jgi:hypothetical protein
VALVEEGGEGTGVVVLTGDGGMLAVRVRAGVWTARAMARGHTSAVRGLAAHPYKPLCASVGREEVLLWDLDTGRAVGHAKVHPAPQAPLHASRSTHRRRRLDKAYQHKRTNSGTLYSPPRPTWHRFRARVTAPRPAQALRDAPLPSPPPGQYARPRPFGARTALGSRHLL